MSALLSAEDLNDFITPGVACIKPQDETDKPTQQQLEIEIDISGAPLEVTKEGTATRLQKAQISLADCLACSGCITSAEEVLVAQHSHKEFLKALKEFADEKMFVASVSHQTRASLAAAFGISVEQTDRFLVKLFVDKLGFTKIVGTGLGRKISLNQMSQNIVDKKLQPDFQTPQLASVCPGWLMYAEKTQPFLLPYMDNTKSPQQITGLLLKRLTGSEFGIKPDQIYHISLMPCFDKKLESVRKESDATVDVDCVITPRELVQLLEDEKIDVDSILNEVANDSTDIRTVYAGVAPQNWLAPVESWLNDGGSASGGYAWHYLKQLGSKYVANGTQPDQLQIRTVEGRNSDIYELELVNTASGETLGRSAVINGFRNIQNMVRKIKQPGKKTLGNARGHIASRRRHRPAKESSSTASIDPQKCDLIEVMACPDGCINGGGQIAAPAGHESAKKWVSTVLQLYNSIPVAEVPDDQLEQWVSTWLTNYNVCSSRLLKATFHQIEQPKDTQTIALTSTW